MVLSNTEQTSIQAAVLNAALSAFQPIVALLLDAGINANEVTRSIRWTFVDEAASRQRRAGKRPSISRIAAATGLSRAEVSQLLARPRPASGQVRLMPRASDRVLNAWASDPDFLDATGKPRPLRYSSGVHSFSELVQRYAGDIPPRAMLNELIASKSVTPLPDGMYAATASPNQPSQSREDAIAQFGAKLNALGTTLLEKIRDPNQTKLFEVLVDTTDLRPANGRRISNELTRRCKIFSQNVERYLLDQARANPEVRHADIDHPLRTLGVIIAIVERASEFAEAGVPSGDVP